MLPFTVMARRPPPAAFMGLDVGEFGSDANAACFRYGGFVERIITWQGLEHHCDC
jgi:hypothetical protein